MTKRKPAGPTPKGQKCEAYLLTPAGKRRWLKGRIVLDFADGGGLAIDTEVSLSDGCVPVAGNGVLIFLAGCGNVSYLGVRPFSEICPVSAHTAGKPLHFLSYIPRTDE